MKQLNIDIGANAAVKRYYGENHIVAGAPVVKFAIMEVSKEIDSLIETV